ncbi:DUF2752 domain-containing protein [Lachnospiraceae bacterium 54-53]
MVRTKKIKAVKRKSERAVLWSVLFLFLLYCVSMYWMTGGLCMFKGLLGIPCPGCGGTRTMLLLAKGDVSGAMELNPSAPLLFICLLNEIRVNYFKNGNKKTAGFLLAAGVFVSVIVYAVRMSMYFPFKEPYVFNGQCLLIKFLRAFHI